MPNWERERELWKFGGRGRAKRARCSWILNLVRTIWIFWLRYFRPTSKTMKNKVAQAFAAIEPVLARESVELTTCSWWEIMEELDTFSEWHWWLITIPAEKTVRMSARALANLATPYLVLNMSQSYQVIPWHHGRVSNTWKIHTGFSGVTWRTSLGARPELDLLYPFEQVAQNVDKSCHTNNFWIWWCSPTTSTMSWLRFSILVAFLRLWSKNKMPTCLFESDLAIRLPLIAWDGGL